MMDCLGGVAYYRERTRRKNQDEELVHMPTETISQELPLGVVKSIRLSHWVFSWYVWAQFCLHVFESHRNNLFWKVSDDCRGQYANYTVFTGSMVFPDSWRSVFVFRMISNEHFTHLWPYQPVLQASYMIDRWNISRICQFSLLLRPRKLISTALYAHSEILNQLFRAYIYIEDVLHMPSEWSELLAICFFFVHTKARSYSMGASQSFQPSLSQPMSSREKFHP